MPFALGIAAIFFSIAAVGVTDRITKADTEMAKIELQKIQAKECRK